MTVLVYRVLKTNVEFLWFIVCELNAWNLWKSIAVISSVPKESPRFTNVEFIFVLFVIYYLRQTNKFLFHSIYFITTNSINATYGKTFCQSVLYDIFIKFFFKKFSSPPHSPKEFIFKSMSQVFCSLLSKKLHIKLRLDTMDNVGFRF